VVTVVAAWMLDAVACVGMEIGEPRAAVEALIELHQLLIERGFRRSFLGESNITQEEQNEQLDNTGAAIHGPAPAQHGSRFRKASGNEPVPTQRGTRPASQPLVRSRRRRGREA
jgi:hypothetical protein